MAYRYTKKSIQIYIPKHLIESFHPHPEPYGEKMVSLKNGMFTDVYEDQNGLYSITNDKDLIDYIKKEGKLR